MRLLALLVLALSVVLALATVSDQAASNGYYEGRSGEILFKPESWAEPESFVIVDNKALSSPAIAEVDVADLISHVSGRFLPINDDVDRTSFPAVNIFNPPKASLIISIASATAEDLSYMPSFATQKHTSVRSSAYPADSISHLTTMLSGAAPSVHGVVGESWPSPVGLVKAYVSEFGQPQVVNLPSLISNTFSGKSLVFSASASAQHAAAMNAHPNLLLEHPSWNNMALFWDGKEFASSARFATDLLSEAQFRRDFASRVPFVALKDGEISFAEKQNAFTVRLASGLSAKFDLSKQEDFLLFVELRMAAYVGEYVQRNEHIKSLVADAIPDFLSFAFSSLEAVKAAYGANSQQTRGALHLIDAAAAQLSAAVAGLYDSAVASVLLGVAAKARLTLPKATLQKLIDSPIVILEPHLETFLPYVYLQHAAADTEKERLGASLSTPGLAVSCKFVPHRYGRELRELFAANTTAPVNTTAPPSGGTLTLADISEFQIILWSSILLLVILLVTLCMMCCMDTGKDTLLFRPPGQHGATSN